MNTQAAVEVLVQKFSKNVRNTPTHFSQILNMSTQIFSFDKN